MAETQKSEEDHDKEIAEALEDSARAQDEWAGVLREMARRMDRLSAEMRKHGAFPIAGSLERERERLERQANAATNER